MDISYWFDAMQYGKSWQTYISTCAKNAAESNAKILIETIDNNFVVVVYSLM